MSDTATKEDLNKATISRNVNMSMVDGKIVAEYNYRKGDYGEKDFETAYYKKIFDDWKSYEKYTTSFFKL